MISNKLLLVFIISVVVKWGNHIEVSCTILPEVEDCNEDDGYFIVGKSYNYDYDTLHRGQAIGTTPWKTSLHINCQVRLNVNGKCQYTLTVQTCLLYDTPVENGSVNADEKRRMVQHPKSEQFSNQMARYPVSFSLWNGSVVDLIAHENEELSILNVKRGIITTLITRNQPTTGNMEMRTDVQGTCPVKYEYHKRSVNMTKNMNECHFPSKSEWFYSPLSLFWNMSFIQMFWINSSANCQYHFRQNGDLRETTCQERHAILLESTQDSAISVQTNIQQTLTLDKVSSMEPVNQDTMNYHLTGIQYEYEKISVRMKNPPNLTKKVVTLMESLINDVKKPIDPETTNLFGELIDVLREAADLTELTKDLPECWKVPQCQNSGPGYTDNQFQVGQIWRDALLQCNRLPCFRAFRLLLTLDGEYVKHVLSDNYLDFVAFTWTNIKITNIDIIQEILEICKLKPKRFCTLTLSSIVHSYWIENQSLLRYQIPTTIRDVVKFIIRPVTLNCPTDKESENDEVIKALQAVTNLGEIVEMVHPTILANLLACVVKNSADISIRTLAIQATERMQSNVNLYNHLRLILKNPDLEHVDHAMAYLLLSEKYGDAKLLEDIEQLLDSEKTEYNLKTLIGSHLKSTLKARDPARKNFTKAIRNSIDPHHLDIIVKGTALKSVSQHKGYKFIHESPFLRDSLKRFEFRTSANQLTDTFHYLLDVQRKFHIQLFGKDLDLLEIFVNNKVTFLPWSSKKHEFPYKINETILNNLLRLEKEWDSLSPDGNTKFYPNPSEMEDADSIISVKFLGDILAYFSSKTSPWISNHWLDSLNQALAHEPKHPITSMYWKVVEAFNQVPTLCGLPLNWTTDAYLIHNSKFVNTRLQDPPNFIAFKSDASVSAVATLRNRMHVALPGFTDYGIQSFSTISTAVGAILGLKLNLLNISSTFGWEMPQRPMQLLSLTRRNSLICRQQLQDIPDWDIDRITENWCTEKMVPFLGVKVCHSKSYPNVTHRIDKPWTLMAGNSHWNYNTDYIAKHKTAYELYIPMTKADDRTSKTYTASLRALDPKTPDKFNDIVNYSHKQNEDTGEYEIELDVPIIPNFKLKATKKQLNSGWQTTAAATIYPGKTYTYESLTRNTKLQKDTGTLKNRLTKSARKKLVSVILSEKWMNITTPEDFYHWSYEHQTFPQSEVYNHFFKYKSVSKPWLTNLLEDTFWEDEQTAWVELYREVSYTFDSLSLTMPPLQSYNFLKNPKSIMQLHTFIGSTPTTERTTTFNLTKLYLPSNHLVTFCNFSNTLQTKKENGLESSLQKTNVTLPWLSLAFDTYYKKNKQNGQQRIDWVFRSEMLDRKSDAPTDVTKQNWWTPNTPDIFDVEINTVKFEAERRYQDPESWTPRPKELLSLILVEVFANLTYSKTSSDSDNDNNFKAIFKSVPIKTTGTDWRSVARKFSLDVPSKFLWNSQVKFDFTTDKSDKEWLWFHSIFTLTSGKKATYNLNLRTTGSEHIVLSDEFKSNVYEFKRNLMINFRASTLDLNITAHSPSWDLLNVDLRQQVIQNYETMNMTHPLVDINVDADWKNGYNKTFYFKSKDTDFIPNMVWKIDFDTINEGIFQFRFPDKSTDFYMLSELSSPHATELTFTFCYQQKCRDLQSTPDSFLTQYILTLEESQYLTIIQNYNPKLTEQIEQLLVQAGTQALNTWQIKYSSRAPLKILGGYVEYVATPVVHYLYSIHKSIFKAALPIIQPAAIIPIKLGHHLMYTPIMNPFLEKTYIGWFWTYFNKELSIGSSKLYKRLWREYYYKPGPTSNSVLLQVMLPIYLPSFLRVPTQISPAFIRMLRENSLIPAFGTPSTFQEIFYDEKYSRFAIFVGTGDIYTFDGKFVKAPRNFSSQCAYLLSQDWMRKKFTIFYQDSSLHFLFPAWDLVVALDGKTYVNGSRHDLPIETWNRDIQLIRKENILELNIKPNFKVICDVKQSYCIFYTTLAMFNRLRGPLGNNNDNPTDELQDISSFALSNINSSCYRSRIDEHKNQIPEENYYKLCNRRDISWSPTSPTLPCHDIIPNTFILNSCYGRPKNMCPTINSYLAACSAHNIPIGKSPDACNNSLCGDHLVGSTWTEKMDQKLEVIFLIDQATRINASNFVKGIENLAYSINNQFIEEGYNSIDFGLVGFSGEGVRYHPQQHTINGNLLGTFKEFGISCLKTLQFTGPDIRNGSIAIEALSYAADYYFFNPKAAHMFILVTPNDPTDEISLMVLHEALSKLEEHSVTIYTISNYLSTFSKMKGTHGVRGDGYVFPQPKSSGNELFIDFPEGQLAKLSSATRGAIWLLSHLEASIPPKQYLQSIANELVARGRQDGSKCKICSCNNPVYYQPKVLCEFVTCDGVN